MISDKTVIFCVLIISIAVGLQPFEDFFDQLAENIFYNSTTDIGLEFIAKQDNLRSELFDNINNNDYFYEKIKHTDVYKAFIEKYPHSTLTLKHADNDLLEFVLYHVYSNEPLSVIMITFEVSLEEGFINTSYDCIGDNSANIYYKMPTLFWINSDRCLHTMNNKITSYHNDMPIFNDHHTMFFINDTFDGDLEGWKFWSGFPKYTLEIDSKAVHLSGDNFVTHIGLEKNVNVSNLTNKELILSFDYRVKSDTSDSTVTNSKLIIYDSDYNELFKESLVSGGIKDTGWQTYQKNISKFITGETQIKIVLSLQDNWIYNHNQHAWFDNIYLIQDNSKEIIFDTFDGDLEGWSLWTGKIGYELIHDSQAAMISGNRVSSVNGIQKTVDISELKNNSLTLSFDYRATSNSAKIDVTNVLVSIYDAESYKLLFEHYFISGGTKDTGWQKYERNIYEHVRNSDKIIIALSSIDNSSEDSKHKNWYDNIQLSDKISTDLDTITYE